jgi:hypothetical protein
MLPDPDAGLVNGHLSQGYSGIQSGAVDSLHHLVGFFLRVLLKLSCGKNGLLQDTVGFFL